MWNNGGYFNNFLGHPNNILLDDKILRDIGNQQVYNQRVESLTRNYEDILKSIGEDTSRQG